MKKLAIISSLAMAATLAFAGMFANASDVAYTPDAVALHKTANDPVALSIPAQLLTIRCGGRKGDIQFSVKELDQMFDMVEKNPDLAPKVCDVFTKRV